MKRRHILYTLFISGFAFLLSGCKYVLLNPQGPVAADEKHLLIDSVLLMLIVVVPVIFLSVWFAWHYRKGNKKAAYNPKFTHSNLLEAICWFIPCMIILVLAVMTWRTTHSLDPYKPLNTKTKPITVQVVSLNWKWLFIYPKQNIATVNYLKIPVNRQIQFLITAEGPMNSLAIPQLAGQIYSMAGMQTKLHILARKEGVYDGFSASFSGQGFSDMKFKVNVVSQKAFDRWAANTKQHASKRLSLSAYERLVKPSHNDPVQYFSPVAPGLYHYVIEKYMKPMHGMKPLTHQ